MYKRILISRTVALVSLAVAVPVATAKPSQGALLRERLQEIGALFVPSTAQSGPTLAGQRALVRERLQEVGAWAVPSAPKSSVVASSKGFDWGHAGMAVALAIAALLAAIAGLVSMRRHHPPVIQ
jgi:hypothetical protein